MIRSADQSRSGLQLVIKAVDLAAKVHAGQRRKGASDTPYINHPIAVAMLVADADGSAWDIAAALLHDVVEDSDITLAEIEVEFGPVVAALVAGLTDNVAWRDLPRSERKARQAEALLHKSDQVRRIKIADQTANVRDIAQDPSGWVADDAKDYIMAAQGVVMACRGTAPQLEAAFDDAAAAAIQRIGGDK